MIPHSSTLFVAFSRTRLEHVKGGVPILTHVELECHWLELPDSNTYFQVDKLSQKASNSFIFPKSSVQTVIPINHVFSSHLLGVVLHVVFRDT